MKEISNSLISQFNLFMSKLVKLEEKYYEVIKDLDSSKAKLEQKIQDISHETELLNKRESAIRSCEESLSNQLAIFRQSESELSSKQSSLDRREAQITKRHESMIAESQALSEKEQDLSKREKLVGMEERRLKMFEHKLNLVAQDEKIKKALREIE